MQSKVNILADDMGNVIRQSANNSEYGYIRLQQDRVTFGNNGWVKKSNVSTLLLGKLEDLQSLDFKAGDQMGGKIVIKEQLEPFNSNDPDRDYKKAGDTGIICCVDGQPIYRKTFYVADTTAEDVLLAHTNGSDIKEANGPSVATKVQNGTTLEAFGITPDAEEVKTEVVDDVIDEVENEETIEEEVLEETFDL
tara:strand:+ start:13446 stop:14027 length:582 start_codon:yes stop_codon:yes gene_type:complete